MFMGEIRDNALKLSLEIKGREYMCNCGTGSIGSSSIKVVEYCCCSDRECTS